jgi:hypothetical protein
MISETTPAHRTECGSLRLSGEHELPSLSPLRTAGLHTARVVAGGSKFGAPPSSQVITYVQTLHRCLQNRDNNQFRASIRSLASRSRIRSVSGSGSRSRMAKPAGQRSEGFPFLTRLLRDRKGTIESGRAAKAVRCRGFSRTVRAVIPFQALSNIWRRPVPDLTCRTYS